LLSVYWIVYPRVLRVPGFVEAKGHWVRFERCVADAAGSNDSYGTTTFCFVDMPAQGVGEDQAAIGDLGNRKINKQRGQRQ
jgi:hypothetical protein